MNEKMTKILEDAVKSKHLHEEEKKNQIVISPEFQQLIYPLTEQELEQLEKNILAEGVRDPLVVWKKNDTLTLIDGHHRYRICKQHNIPFSIKEMEFTDTNQVKFWMINNQIGRRNLTPMQLSYLRGVRYNLEKKNSTENLNQYRTEKISDREKTAEKLAKEYNVTSRTIEGDGQFSKAIDKIGEVDEKKKQDILSGKVKVNKGEIQQLANRSIDQKGIDKITADKTKKRSARKPGAKINDLAIEIAIEYIRNENRYYDHVRYELNLFKERIFKIKKEANDLEFFLLWRLNHSKPDTNRYKEVYRILKKMLGVA